MACLECHCWIHCIKECIECFFTSTGNKVDLARQGPANPAQNCRANITNYESLIKPHKPDILKLSVSQSMPNNISSMELLAVLSEATKHGKIQNEALYSTGFRCHL